MSTAALLDQLRSYAEHNNWDEIMAHREQILAMTGPAAERALALHILGRAHWNRAHVPGIDHDPFDLTLSVRYARQALLLAGDDHDLQGQITKALGTRLVTIGRFAEGRRLLQGWLSRFYTDPQAQIAVLAEVQYTLGYSYRYQSDYLEAETWYKAARQSFRWAYNEEWVHLTTCALAQVQARQGRSRDASDTIAQVPVGGSYEAYRLKAEAEVYAAAGADFKAMVVGEQASEALIDLNDSDPWELAELHLLLADVHHHAGNLEEKTKHLALAMDVLRLSPRHDLYKVACMLLEYESKEVIA